MTATLIEWSTRINAMADALSVPDGGFSVNPHDGSDIRDGYAVAIYPELEEVITRAVTSDDLHRYIARTADTLSLPGRVFGGWCDPETGRAYLDVSITTAHLDQAMVLAQQYQQLAVFDFSSISSIPFTARRLSRSQDSKEAYR